MKNDILYAKQNSRVGAFLVEHFAGVQAHRAWSDVRKLIHVPTLRHHEQPTRQPLLEAVRTIARYRHHDLLEKGLDVSVHKTTEGRHRLHGPCERCARHLCCAPRDLDEKPDGRTLGTEDGLYTRATLPTDCCHLNDTSVRINRYHRDYTAVWEEYMVERTVGVHVDLSRWQRICSSSGISCLRLRAG